MSWAKDQWRFTIYGQRYGRSPNYLAQLDGDYTHEGSGKLKPWIKFNASIQYHVNDKLTLSLLSNNITNKMPPIDHSEPNGSFQPYNQTLYNVFGREMFVEAHYSF